MRAYSLRNVATPNGPLGPTDRILAWSQSDAAGSVPARVAARQLGPLGSVELSWDDVTAFTTGAVVLAVQQAGQWFSTAFRADVPPIGVTEAHAVPPHPGVDPYPLPELEPSVPPFPSRLDAITVKTYFQGAYVYSAAFSDAYKAIYGGTGQIPYFGGATQDFAIAGDLGQLLDQLAALDPRPTHVMVDLSSRPPGYNEPNQPYGSDQLIPPADFAADPDAALPIIDTIVARGFLPVYLIDGEGGPQWIRDNLPAWVARLGPARVRRGPFQVVFDGAWPATWTVADMQTMIPWMRAQIGDAGFLGFMFANDYLWVVNEDDYTQPWMDGLDYIATSNGPDSATCPSLANKAGYMLSAPNFAAANCQPNQGYRFVLADCSRGPRSWSEQEYATYQTTRDPWQVWKPFCDAARARCIALGCSAWG